MIRDGIPQVVSAASLTDWYDTAPIRTKPYLKFYPIDMHFVTA